MDVTLGLVKAFDQVNYSVRYLDNILDDSALSSADLFSCGSDHLL